jgi:uncharacterized protein (DUF433 family)
MKTRKRIEYGKYIVSDPKICGGDLTFKGTRILVKDVLYFVAHGLDWDSISNEYHGLVSREAIAEAVALASAALLEKIERSTQRAEKQRQAA